MKTTAGLFLPELHGEGSPAKSKMLENSVYSVRDEGQLLLHVFIAPESNVYLEEVTELQYAEMPHGVKLQINCKAPSRPEALWFP